MGITKIITMKEAIKCLWYVYEDINTIDKNTGTNATVHIRTDTDKIIVKIFDTKNHGNIFDDDHAFLLFKFDTSNVTLISRETSVLDPGKLKRTAYCELGYDDFDMIRKMINHMIHSSSIYKYVNMTNKRLGTDQTVTIPREFMEI